MRIIGVKPYADEGVDRGFKLMVPEEFKPGNVDANDSALTVTAADGEKFTTGDVQNTVAKGLEIRVADPVACDAKVKEENKLVLDGEGNIVAGGAAKFSLEENCEFGGWPPKPIRKAVNTLEKESREWDLRTEAREYLRNNGMKAVLGVVGALGLGGAGWEVKRWLEKRRGDRKSVV